MQVDNSAPVPIANRSDTAAHRIDTENLPGVINAHRLKFTGDGGVYFGVWIVNLLLMIVTLGLYTPFARRRRHAGHDPVPGPARIQLRVALFLARRVRFAARTLETRLRRLREDLARRDGVLPADRHIHRPPVRRGGGRVDLVALLGPA